MRTYSALPPVSRKLSSKKQNLPDNRRGGTRTPPLQSSFKLSCEKCHGSIIGSRAHFVLQQSALHPGPTAHSKTGMKSVLGGAQQLKRVPPRDVSAGHRYNKLRRPNRKKKRHASHPEWVEQSSIASYHRDHHKRYENELSDMIFERLGDFIEIIMATS